MRAAKDQPWPEDHPLNGSRRLLDVPQQEADCDMSHGLDTAMNRCQADDIGGRHRDVIESRGAARPSAGSGRWHDELPTRRRR